MRVDELIEKLSLYPQDAEVFVNISGDEYFCAEWVADGRKDAEGRHFPVIFCSL